MKALRVLSIISTVAALALITFIVGFAPDFFHDWVVRIGMDTIFAFFALIYFVKLIYSTERFQYIRDSWFEGIVMIFIIVSGINHFFFDISVLKYVFKQLNFHNYREFYTIFITLSMLYLIGHRFIRASAYIHLLAFKPAGTFIFSFIFLISLGTGFLLLPEMCMKEGGASFMEAFFTSVSASCVTGLIIVDTATYWTLKGQIVILFLMQLGGIGIVSFATFFTSFMRAGMGIKHQVIMQDFLSADSLFSAQNMIRKVVTITISFELCAAILVFFTWGSNIEFNSLGQQIFYSIFHAVSAFCNAGFSLFSDGLYQEEIRESLLLHTVVGVTIFFGSLGFSTIQDVMSPTNLRERLEKPWKDWALSSKISVYTSVILVIFGMLLFYLIEQNNSATLGEMGGFEALIASFFQSVTTRTAGFNTVDFSSILTPTLIFMIIWMFIGASSGSTGGGIKTSTFLLITISSISTIRGKKTIDFGKRHISNDLLFKAFSIFSFAVFYNLVMIFILSITEPGIDIIQIVFEQISAFATVGLSTGITSELQPISKSVIILSMFVGRVGTLTLALALSTTVSSNNYKYPNEHLLIG